MGPYDAVVPEGWTEAAEEPGPPERRRRLLGVVLGPLFVAIGGVLGAADIADRVHFDGAARADAVVVRADYAKTGREDAEAVEVRLAGDGRTVEVDDPRTAPDGLVEGREVTVLVDGRGHVLFPGQLGWGKTLFPLGFTGIGLAATVDGVAALVRRRSGKPVLTGGVEPVGSADRDEPGAG
ncbi:hypothetical protein ABT095_31860 [Kitasatospora sp. NPDC002227]|uniref:hypothetical protein n=1 Tax=Kitasatospora sp. NPDC002227 TaxID=3154773 RepID=UPI0033204A1C